MAFVYLQKCATITAVRFRTFYHLKKKGWTLYYADSPIPLQPQATTNLYTSCLYRLSDSGHFVSVESYNLWPLMSGFFHVAQCFKAHPCCSVDKHCLLAYGHVISHCMDGLHFIYPFIRWWTFDCSHILALMNHVKSLYEHFLEKHLCRLTTPALDSVPSEHL